MGGSRGDLVAFDETVEVEGPTDEPPTSVPAPYPWPDPSPTPIVVPPLPMPDDPDEV